MDHRREIDGLRSLAVIPVILFHAGFEVFSGGFIGVDIFFVISGYLITSIIFSELSQGNFSLVNFYERRARRILPALFFVMLVSIPFAWLWLLPDEMREFSQSLVAVPMFASNIFFWREIGYFDTAAELKPLLHTWSLALEEQYYLLFPLFLMALWRFGKRWILISLGLLFLLSLLALQIMAYEAPSAAFFLLPARGWELLMGGFAAIYLDRPQHKDSGKIISELGGWAGVTLILFSIFTYTRATPFSVSYALVPTIGTMLIIVFATSQTTVGRLIGNKAFVGIGLISYSAYLWHQPLFAFARIKCSKEHTPFALFLLSIMALVFAYFSWRFVETPFRGKCRLKKKKVFTSAFAVSGIFVFLGLLGHFRNGNLWKYSDDVARYFQFKNDSDSFVWVLKNKLRGTRFDEDKVKILIIGDSNSADFLNVLYASDKKKNFSFSTLRIDAGCGNLYLPRENFSSHILSRDAKTCSGVDDLMLQKNKNLISEADWVILASSWRSWESELFDESYHNLVADFGDKFFVFGNKHLDFTPVDFIRVNSNASFPQTAHREAEKAEINLKLKRIARERFIDPYDYFCQGEDCLVFTSKGDMLLYDGFHLSQQGTDFFAHKLRKLASRLVEKS